jgi:hypothetical protein
VPNVVNLSFSVPSGQPNFVGTVQIKGLNGGLTALVGVNLIIG